MNVVNRWCAIARESLATAWAQPVASVVSIVMVAGMVATVLLTTGRTVGSEQRVLNTIDTAGTRSIVVKADVTAGIDTTVLDRIRGIDGISWAGAFGAATDVQNAAYPGGRKVPVRLAWSDNLEEIGISADLPVENISAIASQLAMDQLGMPDNSGGVVSASGATYGIVGQFAVPDFLGFLEPLVIVPQALDDRAPAPVAVIVVVAERPDLVAPVSEAIQSLLAPVDGTKVKIATSESLVELRGLVQGQLGSFGRNLVIVVFGLTAVLVSAILYGLVMLRRKDFGRRRALGASQGLIVALLLVQMAALALAGAVLGSIAAAVGLSATGDPLPGFDFFLAVSILAVAVGVVSALLPAFAAARRDPLKELRVP